MKVERATFPACSNASRVARARQWCRVALRCAALGLVWLTICGSCGWSQPGGAAVAAEQNAAQSAGVQAESQPNDQPPADGDAAPAPEPPPLPKLEEMSLPTVEELLTKPPVDWVVLKTGEVVVCQPVHPRPDTIAKLQKQLADSASWKPPPVVRQPGESDESYEARRRARIEEFKLRKRKLEFLEIVLPQDATLPDDKEEPVYYIDLKDIDRIIYYEDLMLQRIDKLLDQGDYRTAFELLLVLDRRHRDWPGYAERVQRLLFLEAADRYEKKLYEQALAYLEDLHQRNPRYPQLFEQLGKVVQPLIDAALAREDYRRARYFIRRLASMEPQHPVAVRTREELMTQARQLVAAARSEWDTGDYAAAADRAEQAARVWPELREVSETFQLVTRRYQRLYVGVVAEQHGFVVPPPSARRRQELMYARLFEVDAFDDAAHYRTDFVEEYTPEDLGRRLILRLRRAQPYWKPYRPLTAAELRQALLQRLRPDDALYDDRLASFVRSIDVDSPYSLTIHFGRVPVSGVALLSFPLTAPASTGDSSENGKPTPVATGPRGSAGRAGVSRVAFVADQPSQTPDSPGALSGDRGSHVGATQRFVQIARHDRSVRFRRVVPEPDGVEEYHVAEVVEIEYDSYEKLLQGLLRGEVSVVPRMPSWLVDKIEATGEYFVQPYAVPTTHVLIFNPRSRIVRNTELRRALAYAIDREKLLKEVVLKDPLMRRGKIISAAFPSESNAYHPLVKPRPYDLYMAYALTVLIKQARGGEMPVLKMACEPDPLIRETAQAMIANWKRIGIQVELAELPPDAHRRLAEPSDVDRSERAEWDMAYRTVRMAEPLTELWSFLTLDPHARVESLQSLPDWLRLDLAALDEVVDWQSARRFLNTLHKKLQSNVRWIPLWEIQEALVIRKNIRGFPERPMNAYHRVEQWIVQPWYPRDR